MQNKKCTKCGIEKPVDGFYKSKKGKYGVRGDCKLCHEDVISIYLQKNQVNWSPAIDGSRKCSRCKRELPVAEFGIEKARKGGCSTYCRSCQQDRRQETRFEVLKAYSGDRPACACCGETTVEFLSLDHIDGGGMRHRKETGVHGFAFYRQLKRQGFPAGYQVLCHNCNQAKGFYGICPHQRGTNGIRLVEKSHSY